MKKIYFYFAISLATLGSAIGQTTPIPDSTFENWLISEGIDTNGANGNILNTDAAGVKELILLDIPVANWTGIEAFVDLERLLVTSFFNPPSANHATASSIDVSQNLKLRYLQYRRNNSITGVDVSANTSLDSLAVEQNGSQFTSLVYNNNLKLLNIGASPGLTSIDLSGNTLLESLTFGSSGLNSITLPSTANNLTTIIMGGFSNISSLDFSAYPSLEQVFSRDPSSLTNINFPSNSNLNLVDVSNSSLTGLDLSNSPILTSLNVSGCNSLATINLSNCTSLPSLNASGLTSLGTVNIANCTSLTSLDVSNLANLTGVNLTNCIALRSLLANDSDLTSLDLSTNTALRSMECMNNRIGSINFGTSLPNLLTVRANDNQLASVNLTPLIAATELYFNNNFLSGSGVTLGTHNDLTTFDANFNDISTLNVSGCPSLQTLNMRNNSLSTIDVSANQNLRTLLLSDNILTSLNVTADLNIQNIDVSNNSTFTGFTFGNNTNLLFLRANDCNINSQSFNTLTNLVLLFANNNNLSSIDLTSNMILEDIELFNNNLSTLDLSMNPLINLNISQNSITNLDLSSKGNLRNVICNDNNLTTLNLKNGNNMDIMTMDARNNNSLSCIEVDDANGANAGAPPYFFWQKDASTVYSENCTTLSVADFESKEITLFPNPVKESFTIKSGTTNDIKLYDLQGKMVKYFSEQAPIYNIKELTSGIYFAHIASEKGIAIKRIVKL